MLGLDQYAPFLLSALGITIVVLGGYGLYLRSRLSGLSRPQSARPVTPPSAQPVPSTSRANDPSTP
jgi:hypothetical protein